MLIVQKYGGTSVGSIERIKGVAQRVAATHDAGHRVAVVVSAMSGETNRLLGLAKQISPNPDERECDVLVSTGEQVTVALSPLATFQHETLDATGRVTILRVSRLFRLCFAVNLSRLVAQLAGRLKEK